MPGQQIKINVRMYKVGELGDCFLLQIKEGEISSNVLIDCGSFRNSNKSKEQIQAIWKNIREELNGKPLNVVVGTHQHNDHVSGFVHGKDEFKSLKPEQVWLSWMDNPRDSLSANIKLEQEIAIRKLTEIGNKIPLSPYNDIAVFDKLKELLEFSSNLDNEPAVPAEGIRILKSIGTKPVQYLEPGKIIPLPQLENSVRVYVLGPPKDHDKLHDIHASPGESYDPRLAAASVQAQRIISAISNVSGNPDDWEERHFPFTDHYKIKIDENLTSKAKCLEVWQEYEKQAWRKIDHDWLDEVGNLALFMDRYTNNTSLVLAFELIASKKVLLFVGDAQTGNWSSWKNITWPDAPTGFSANDLLKNTILYKVGHHCSHNATLVEGLEAMIDDDLVAMIPVDATDPNITKEKGWKMPAKNLYNKLKEKTHNRVLRMDTGFADGCESDRDDGKLGWKSLSYSHEVKTENLFVEYEVNI